MLPLRLVKTPHKILSMNLTIKFKQFLTHSRLLTYFHKHTGRSGGCSPTEAVVRVAQKITDAVTENEPGTIDGAATAVTCDLFQPKMRRSSGSSR